MEDIIALVIVVGGFALFGFIVRKLQQRIKRDREIRAKKQAEADAYWKKQRESINMPDRWNPVTPQQYADILSGTTSSKPKSRPAMKKANVKSTDTTYANTPMTSTTSTAAVMPNDNFFDGIVTGMVVNSLVDSFNHKSEPSVGVTKSESSWGFDDSDSRKSISDSMDTSSSWSSSSSDFGSSDSGPSSDW